jgi:hypothetical protein
MTDLANLKTAIMDWANRQDWSDALVTSFIRMAEQKFNQELRIALMIQFDQSLIIDRCAPLPPDWLEMDLVRIESPLSADGFMPIHYKPRDEFFRATTRDDASVGAQTNRYYTLEGRQIYFGGVPDSINGTTYKIAYFAEVPPLNDTAASWLNAKYPSLYLYGCLMNATMHAVGEEQSASNWKSLCEDTIAKLNKEYLLSKASGSRVLRSRLRSFG